MNDNVESDNRLNNNTGWKAIRDELYKKIQIDKAWFDEQRAEFQKRKNENEVLADQMFACMKNDTVEKIEWLKEVLAKIGRNINWDEYKWWYIGGGLVLFFLVMHYVFGI